MGLTTRYVQTGVHRCLPFLGLTMKITQQDSDCITNIEHDAL